MNNRYVRNNTLDILKGLLSIFIIITHSSLSSNYRDSKVFPYIIDMAVPVFLIISGYVNAIAMENKNIADNYRLNILLKKIKRVMIPFFPFVVVTTLYWLVIDKIGIKSTLANILFQQWGPGGYYPIIMIQFVMIFPLLLKYSRSIVGVIILCLIDCLSEVMFSYMSRDGGIIAHYVDLVHRLCILRYLGFIIAGILIYRYKDKVRFIHVGVCCFFGALMVGILNCDVFPHYFFSLWRSTSIPVALWAASWVLFTLLVDKKVKKRCKERKSIVYFLAEYGRASYSVFLVQMFWFFLIGKRLLPDFPLAVNVVVCCTLGYLYFWLINIVLRRKYNV